ncbi:MAG TPA: hypothetical protein VFI27_19530 [candidate division Zixibacteria bacterium]|nr:hypothetical protein [candidate division Zixibacteria bacterium]
MKVPCSRWLWLLLSVALIPISCRQEEPVPAPGLELERFPAQVTTYNLGETTILQDQFPEESPFRHMPVRLEGVIGVPESDSQHPVVLIMHGKHIECPVEFEWPCSAEEEHKNYEGFTYLVEALAKAGYVALAINVNAEHTLGFGEGPPTVRTQQLIDLHLGELAAANAVESDAFGLDLSGRADMTQMVWLGHSRGGDIANWIIRDQKLDRSAREIGYGPVQGLIHVAAPAAFIDSLPAVDLPTALILPACDWDVLALTGQQFYESARFDPDRVNFLSSIYLEHANHNYFNSTLPADPLLDDRPDCEANVLLDPQAQQDFLVQYTIDFLQTLYAEPDLAQAAYQRLGILPSEPAPDELYGALAKTTLAPAKPDTRPLIRPESEQELSVNLLGGDVQLTGIQATFCPEGYYVPESAPGTEPCKRVNLNQPGNPQQLAVQWEDSGAEFRTSMPKTAVDWSQYAALQLRVALDPLSELNVEGQPLSFTVELVDGRDRSSHVTVSDVEYPPGVRLPNDHFEGDSFSGHVTMPTLRIPLEEFEGIDLANITEIALLFDQTQAGALFIADLEMVKGDS